MQVSCTAGQVAATLARTTTTGHQDDLHRGVDNVFDNQLIELKETSAHPLEGPSSSHFCCCNSTGGESRLTEHNIAQSTPV
jgi:hypothetical protein